jgi:hypothetical protein
MFDELRSTAEKQSHFYRLLKKVKHPEYVILSAAKNLVFIAPVLKRRETLRFAQGDNSERAQDDEKNRFSTAC